MGKKGGEGKVRHKKKMKMMRKGERERKNISREIKAIKKLEPSSEWQNRENSSLVFALLKSF